MAPVLSNEFLDIQATIECGFILKRVRIMIRTYCQMQRTDKYSQHLSQWVTPASVEEILDKTIFLTPHTKLIFSSDNSYFYWVPFGNISGKFTIIRCIFRFLQRNLISSTTFEEKLGLPTANHKRTYYGLWSELKLRKNYF